MKHRVTYTADYISVSLRGSISGGRLKGELFIENEFTKKEMDKWPQERVGRACLESIRQRKQYAKKNITGLYYKIEN